MNEYIIVADYEIYGKVSTCLVLLCGKDRAHAEKVLNDMLTTDKYKRHLANGVNPRIREKVSKECWWNQGGLD